MHQLDQLDPANPFADQDYWRSGWPPLDRITDEHVVEALTAAIADRAAVLASVRDAARPPVFDDVLEIERAHDLLWPIQQAWSVLLKTAGNPDRHQLNETLAPLRADADAAAWLDAGLAARVAELHDRRDELGLGLDEQDLALLDRVHQGFRQAGAHLSSDDRETLRELDGQQARLQAEIERRLGSGLAAAAVHVIDRAELAGLDDAEIADAATAAADRGLAGWLITQSGASVPDVLARLHDAGLRRRVYDAASAHGSSGEHDTRHLVVDLLRLRARRARLLGYSTHAELVHAELTAGSLATVRGLLHQLAPVAARLAATEDAALGLDGPVPPWDRPLLTARTTSTGGDGQVDPREYREYLALDTVLAGVTDLIDSRFGVRFHVRADLRPHVPHAWVWQATDTIGRHLGLVLVDLHRRPGKRAGAWTTELVAQSSRRGRRPVVSLCANLPGAETGTAPNGQVLLSPGQAAQLWHEMGHVVHAMLSEVRHPGDAGHASLPRDVIEVTSVVFEHWALDPAVLPGYARHHITGDPIPDALVAQLAATRPGAGVRLVEDVAASLVDLALHDLAPDQIPATDDLDRSAARVLADAGLDDTTVPLRYPIAAFRHITVGGYDCRYNSYLLGDILAAQIDKWDECVSWMRETMALGALGADRFPLPDPAPFLASLGVTD
ncbi:M3 family metallopeptidase [Lentzea sp. CA-135723]|uniref:M3 family metallopeptidase n=1 Tax=Lentzea sp. CA-135723 TaxID=3239950 RepID=UPI003D9290FD